MVSILKPFSNIVTPGKFQVPSGQLAVDWGSCLTNGLLAAYVPNSSGDVIELTGNAGPLRRSVGSVPDGMAPDGPGMANTATTGGATSSVLPTSSPFQTMSNITIFTRFHCIGASSNNAVLFSIYYNDAGTTPFLIAALTAATTGTLTDGIKIGWAAGGFRNLQTATLPLTAGTTFSILGTIVVNGGTAAIYYNGVSKATGVIGGTSLDAFSATTRFAMGADPATAALSRTSNGIVLAGYLWNRILDINEIINISNSPYDFIIPAEYELSALKVPPSGIVFRRTLSQFGSRVGSRQQQGFSR